MNKTIIVTILIFLYSSLLLNAQTLFISTKVVDYDASYKSDGEAHYFATTLANKISKEFPCLSVIIDYEFRAVMEHVRGAALLGNNAYEEKFWEGQKNSERTFAVELTVTRDKKNCYYNALCMSLKDAENISSDIKSIPSNSKFDAIDKLVNSMSKTLVRNLAYYEPCAYRGDINLKANELSASKDSTNSLTNCDGYLGTRMKIFKSKKETNVDWKLSKYDKITASGTAIWHIKSSDLRIDSTECYPCKSGKPGYRRSELTTESEFNGSGVPKDILVGQKEFFRISTTLKFNEDSTFFFKLHGSTASVTSDAKTREKVTGCDEDELMNIISASESVYIDVTLGPFKGSPMDKELHLDGNQDIKNSANKSGTYKYNFTLKRK